MRIPQKSLWAKNLGRGKLFEYKWRPINILDTSPSQQKEMIKDALEHKWWSRKPLIYFFLGGIYSQVKNIPDPKINKTEIRALGAKPI